MKELGNDGSDTENLIFATQIKRRMRDLSRRTEKIVILHMPRYPKVLHKIVDTELYTRFHFLIGFSEFVFQSILGLHDLHSANIYRYHRSLEGGTKYCTRVRVQYFISPRGRQPEAEIFSYGTEGPTGPSAIRWFRPHGEE